MGICVIKYKNSFINSFIICLSYIAISVDLFLIIITALMIFVLDLYYLYFNMLALIFYYLLFYMN